MEGVTHSRSGSTSTASLTRQTTRSLRQGRKGSVTPNDNSEPGTEEVAKR